jgi:GR25 family glycosyltransferase involved in LPS biosynthesis
LEDDAILGPRAPDALEVFAKQTFFDLVKLEGITYKARHNFGAEMVAGPPAIYLMETVSGGTAAYALTRLGAQKLLRITAPMNREVDRFIRAYGLTDLVVGEFRPFPAQQDRAESYVGGARLSRPPAPLPDRLVRGLLKARSSLTRRLRCKHLLGGKPLVAVTMEGSSPSVFGSEI